MRADVWVGARVLWSSKQFPNAVNQTELPDVVQETLPACLIKMQPQNCSDHLSQPLHLDKKSGDGEHTAPGSHGCRRALAVERALG